MLRYPSVLITGASGGIGRALAIALAAPGVVLHLGGRDAGRLAAVADACCRRGARAVPHAGDVRDGAEMAAWIAGSRPLSLVVANAGISAGTGDGHAETAEQIRAVFASNIDGVLNTVLPAWAAMRDSPADVHGVRGRIGVVASIAAFVAVPGAPSYCASKAAVDRWTVASAPQARRDGVLLSSICPGYVRTAMTAGNHFPMPGLMDADRAAALILRGLAAGRRRISFPWWMAAVARAAGALPPGALAAAFALLPGKPSLDSGD
jgi:NADP-dependent 3-hydroxy acid dehydrogenase YdfG